MLRHGAAIPSADRKPSSCTDVGNAGPISCTSSKTNWVSACSSPNEIGQPDRGSPYPRSSSRDSTMSCVPTSTASRSGAIFHSRSSLDAPPSSRCNPTTGHAPPSGSAGGFRSNRPSHPSTTRCVCSTSDRCGSTTTSRRGVPRRTPGSGCSRRRNNHGNTAAIVFPDPVGTHSRPGNPSAANRSWYPYGSTPAARQTSSANSRTASPLMTPPATPGTRARPPHCPASG
jgi:hypothetical protein